MFISEYIKYGEGDTERLSTDFGLYLIKMEMGMSESAFGLNQNIIEQKAQGNPIPYFIGVQQEPLELNITLGKQGTWSEQDKIDIVKWLYQGDYKPLISSDDLGTAYYCQPIGDARRFFNGLGEGYIQITMRCNAPYGFSYPIQTQYHDLRIGGTNTIIMENRGNVDKYIYPEIEIQRFENAGVNSTFQLVNTSDEGRIFKFTDLEYDEKIYVHNKRKQILTSVPNRYRYGNFNNGWLRLLQGENHIVVTGSCTIKTRVQFPISK